MTDARAARSYAEAARVAAAFGLRGCHVRLLQRRQNWHWLLVRGPERFVLRRYGDHQTMESALWEAEVLRALHGSGWPVPMPMCEPMAVDGSLYVVFPFLEGRPMGGRSDDQYRHCGRLLAEFHARTRHLVPYQRPGSFPFVEFDKAPFRRSGGDPWFARLASVDHELARLAESTAVEVAERLRSVAAAGFERQLVHCDLVPWNLRFRDGTLSALFDFDASHIDARATDVACVRRCFNDSAVQGYLAAGSLTSEELASLDALWKVPALFHLRWVMRSSMAPDGAADQLEWCRRQLTDTRAYGG